MRAFLFLFQGELFKSSSMHGNSVKIAQIVSEN